MKKHEEKISGQQYEKNIWATYPFIDIFQIYTYVHSIVNDMHSDFNS